MKRPESELLHTDLAKGVQSTRRLLAYLLRATRLRVQPKDIGDHRWRRLATEIGDALIPMVVAERSPLAFYRVFCSRFRVDPAGGDSEWGPIEAWLPEGRVRWDRVLAALDYEDVRTVVHESPEFLATFACSSPLDVDSQLEDEEFAAFPDPTLSGHYQARLPESLITPRGYHAVWTLTAPMHHGADEKHGNVSLFRRQASFDPLMGRRAYVPFLSGNAIRGLKRDTVMGRWLGLLGLKPTDIPPARAHSLLAGGAVDQGADTATVNNVIRRRARELCPPWDLLAGCTDQQIMGGRARISDGTLVCRENAWKVWKFVAPEQSLDAFAASLPMSSELTQIRQGTRHKHAELDAWEQHLPDGCSDVTGLALGTEGTPWPAVRVLIAPDQCVALAYIDGEWWDYHCYLSAADPIDDAKAALRGLVEKYESQRTQRAALETDRADLDAWIAAHPDVEVTIDDSLRVRHCRPGTEQFRDEHFPGRVSVTVAELAPLAASDERVRLVLAGVMSRAGDAALQAAS